PAGARRARDADALGERQGAEAQEAPREVRRRRERAAGDPGRRRAGREDGDREPALDRREVLDAEPAQERAVCRAAAQEDMLAVVDAQALALGRPGGAAEARARLEKPHARPPVGAVERRGDPPEPAPRPD